jgi:large subunit ribosomal protein L29
VALILMVRVKLKTLREMNNNDLSDKLSELKADLAKLRSEGAKGTLKKQTGTIRWIRRDIARIMTLLNERKSSQK